MHDVAQAKQLILNGLYVRVEQCNVVQPFLFYLCPCNRLQVFDNLIVNV